MSWHDVGLVLMGAGGGVVAAAAAVVGLIRWLGGMK